MAGFYAILYERSLNGAYNTAVPLPISYKITPIRYSAKAIGGDDEAEPNPDDESTGDDLGDLIAKANAAMVISNGINPMLISLRRAPSGKRKS